MKSSSELRFFLACGFFGCAGGDWVVVSPPPDGAPAPAATAMLGAMTSAAAIDIAASAASRLTDESTPTEVGFVSTFFMTFLSARFFFTRTPLAGPAQYGAIQTTLASLTKPCTARPLRNRARALN